MNGPEISVVIPTRDRWHRLMQGALPSALAQVGVSHEVIVVDDGSADETARRLASLDDPRLVVLRHERPRGLSAARNTGIEAARGDWLAFLDDDDLWAPNKLRAQLDAIRGTEAPCIYSGVVVVTEAGDVYQRSLPDPAELLSELLVRSAVPGGSSNVLARTEAVRGVGAYDEDVRYFEDWDLWLRLLSSCGPPVAIPDVLVACSAHGENTYVRSQWRDIADAMQHFTEKHRSLGVSIDVARFSRWAALERARGGERLEPAWFLMRTAFRHRRPRYGLQAVGLLVPRRASGRRRTSATSQEPDWLREIRIDTGWPEVGSDSPLEPEGSG